jgi:hypothetical protein
MKNIVKQYTQSIAWSTAEAIIFQTALLVHQAALFKVVSPQLYGLTGTIFGLIYFGVKLFDLGLSRGLMTFYHTFTASKRSCVQFFAQQLLPNLIFCCVAFLSVWIAYIFFNHRMYGTLPIDSFLLTIACGLALTESIKTILKRLLQLSYNFRHVALCEIGFIICYQIAIWSYYFYTGSVNAYGIIGFCFAMSLLEVTGLSVLTYQWYSALPAEHPTHQSTEHTKLGIFKSRLLVYSHSISKQFFSGNILIPLCAYSYGLEAAALLKLASYVTHSITAIIEKIIDPSSSALFAHTKNDSAENKQKFFSLVSSASSHILVCIFIFILINSTKLFSLSHATIAVTPYIILYFLIHYFENFFITVEKFYIAHDRSEFLTIGTILNSIVALAIFTYCLSPLVALTLFLLSRITSFIILVCYLSFLWNIRPHVRVAPRYILGSLVIAILCRIIF